MNPLVAAVQQHPVVLAIAVLVAVYLVLYAVVAAGEPDDRTEVRPIGWRQRWCGLRHGHDAVLAFDGGAMLMRCTSCLYATPGLRPAPTSPRRRYDAKPDVLATGPLRLMPPRRSA